MTEADNKKCGDEWVPAVYLYCLYHVILLAGGLAGLKLNFIAATLFLFSLYVCYWKHLGRLRSDALFCALVVSMVIPLISIAISSEYDIAKTFQELIKYYSLSLVMLIGLALSFPPICRSKKTWILIVIIIFFQMLGWFWTVDDYGSHLSRVKGFSVNPNNFALSAMMILFLLDEEKLSRPVRWLIYSFVLSFIYVSRTGGAIVGFLSGMCYKFIFSRKRGLSMRRSILLMIICLALTSLFAYMPENTLPAVDNTILKLKLFEENIDVVLAGKRIDYGSIVERTGNAESSSLAWRFSHWNKIINAFMESPILIQLFGYGIGMSDVKYGIKPHNDYLRILYETGMIGFFAILTMWAIIYRRMDVRFRWLAVMVAVFSFSENNFDHFPAMSLLILYMLSANKSRQAAGDSDVEHIRPRQIDRLAQRGMPVRLPVARDGQERLDRC